MTLKKHIPNLITLLNLLSGTIAVYLAANGELVFAAYFIILGIFFDFFDGLAARLLKVHSELGKQLDSLADVVTSGVAPGIIIFQMLNYKNEVFSVTSDLTWEENKIDLVPFIGFLITLAAAYRLAKFNIDERQTNSFIGLPTPAAALVVLSLPLILLYDNSETVAVFITNRWFLIGLTFILSILMNAEIPLFSLKFKDFSWRKNSVKYIFIVATIILMLTLKFTAIPIVVLLYVVMSVVGNTLLNKEV